jgi:hypothetical protein
METNNICRFPEKVALRRYSLSSTATHIFRTVIYIFISAVYVFRSAAQSLKAETSNFTGAC